MHAVIRSSAVGHPGRAAPGPQYGRLVGRALAAAGLRPPGTGPQPPDAGAQSEVPGAGLEAVGSLWRRVPGRWRRWWVMPGR
ncbi:hypothetical protein O1M63_06645 [Streptomyces mirabilis]|nr:hypothetical protein [Streptomyces mirabilis]